VVDILAREGIIDRSKVGLCGHSFSATAVTYAISHSNAFHAAVIGGAGSTNPLTYELTTITPDSYRAELWSVRNLPPVDNDPERIWQQVSPAANAAAIHAPLLMELPESEYFPELELLRAIERAGGVSEMYVFPGEGHWSGRRPVQQYWRSLRAIDWLDFWLTGHEQRTSSNAQELERWEAAASQSRAPTEN
jgi:dipeptidyl aminopeptidase/acylaminoacyl peptidase